MMITDDSHALSGAYAVDALDDVERIQFEQHLSACIDCAAEVTSLRDAAALLAETTPVAPPPLLRERVLAEIATVRPLPPVVRLDRAPTAPSALPPLTPTAAGSVTSLDSRRRRRTGARLLAAAAAVVAIGGGGLVWHQVTEDRPSQSVAAQVMAAPDVHTYRQDLGKGMTATVYRSTKLNEAVLVTHGFPIADSGKEYALWLLHDGTAVPAGVLPRSADNQIVLSGDAATATAAGITVEDAGATLTTPSGPMVANIAFQET